MDKEIYDILDKIEKQGYSAYIVGGYVRDSIMNKKNYDVDIATSATVKDLSSLLNGNITSTYGSFKINVKSYNIDITTYRKEISYNGRYPEIIYIDDVKEDILRRDFTINSILMDKNGHIIDYLGGINDISKRVIKCIGNPDDRFREDPLRILRALRFSATLEFKIDNDTMKSIKRNIPKLSELSLNLVRKELDKILICKNPTSAMNNLKKLGVLKELGIDYKKLYNVPDYLGMYAQLSLPENYPFTKVEKHTIKELKNIIKYGKIDNIILYDKGLFLASLGGETLGIKRKKVVNMNNKLPIHSRSDIDITINELINIGVPKNNLSNILKDLERQILNKKVRNNKEDIVKYINKRKV